MTTPRILLAAALLALPAASFAQPCTPHVVTGYNTAASLSGSVTAATIFRGQLLASGTLQVGGLPTRFARFNGQSWEALFNLTANGKVNVMEPRTENGQEVLYIGGAFTTVNGQPMDAIARWDGATATPLPGVFSIRGVETLAFYDDGSGPALYAGHYGAIKRWDGTSWTMIGALGGGANQPYIRALQVFDDGTGMKLYAAGCFDTIAGQPIHSIAAWDGGSWQPANSGLLARETYNTDIYDLTIHDDGSGPRLYAAGCINTIARNWGDTAVARLDGGVWTSVMLGGAGEPLRSATSLLSTAENGVPTLYASAGSTVEDPRNIRVYANGAWTNLGGQIVIGDTFGFGPGIRSLLMIPDTAGHPHITAFGQLAGGALRWTGSAWSTIETWSSVPPPPANARIYTDPAATDGVYYIDGAPRKGNTYLDNTAPVAPTRGLARFSRNGQSLLVFASHAQTAVHDGQAWTMLPEVPGNIQTLRASRDTAGQGDTAFLVTATDTAAQVYRLDGLQWSPVGPPIEVNSASLIQAVQTFSSGAGPEVYLAGLMGPANARCLVRLVGDEWLDVPGVDGPVYDLTIFDVGEGPELVMAGNFIASTGQTSGGVSRWNGARIAPIGSGITGPGSSLAVFNDGSGPRLFLGATIANPPLRSWTGSSWASVGLFSPAARISALAPITRADGGRSLMITGSFTAAAGIPANNLAEYAGCRESCTADFNGDGDVGTDQDIESFFACFGGNCCPNCASPDFNGDGDVATDQDIESFFRVLGGGNC